ncbi:hypothetical protein [Dactylosporangium fulvum]|uniref:Uncharacterized protein n=1 Tax=Dactylosporangium fulvum TaxID=53359 RepID=A0ABY5W0I6_9ACTN|nr:hypothetical protein [Dactylosporangium fulvum]UWP82544.1 hypothetical protein Dfulv_47190 [Dactylosporangium fulvum]
MFESVVAEFLLAVLFNPAGAAGLIGAAVTAVHRRSMGPAFWPALLGFILLAAGQLTESYLLLEEQSEDLVFRIGILSDIAWSALLTVAVLLGRIGRGRQPS